MNHISHLPGHELVEKGQADLQAGVKSLESLLLEIGRPRFERLGIHLPRLLEADESPELALYEMLAEHYENEAHSRYNALLRRLVSYQRCLEASYKIFLIASP